MGRYSTKTANHCLMKISILCEGRLNKGIENELCDIYIKRTLSLKQSGILNLEIKNKPNKRINNKNIKNLTLDENGKHMSTMDLVDTIKKLNNNRIEFLNFFIGKPEGLSEDYSEYEKISLSKMTLPHSLARVILCEQIYRCATILTNHPYHKS